MLLKGAGPQDLNNEILTLERQKASMEKLLSTREEELHQAEYRISQLMNGNGILD